MNGEKTNDELTMGADERPVECVLDLTYKMFRVIRAKGKALSSGGFGVSIRNWEKLQPTSGNDNCDAVDDAIDRLSQPERVLDLNSNEAIEQSDGPTKSSNASVSSAVFLFIEEVLFLHESGLLEAKILSEFETEESHLHSRAMETSQLYQILPKMGLELPVYLVYSHLRSQDFRVLRHDVNRFDILRLQQQQDTPREKAVLLRRELQKSIQNATPPFIPINKQSIDIHHSSDSITTGSRNIRVCWDVYNPNCNFAKTHPGLPDFCVAITYYNVPLVTFSELQYLINGPCNGIPLKIATVSDSGTVLMFGVTDCGIPSLPTRSHESTGLV